LVENIDFKTTDFEFLRWVLLSIVFNL
jgi:hypothetical protein